MPNVPVPLPLSTYCEELLGEIKSARCVMSYDPGTQGLAVHHWPVKPNGERVPPDELRLYRETHEYRGPGCLCPLLEPLTAYKETATYLTVDGRYKGEYVVECVDDRCDYLSKLPLERMYLRRSVPEMRYPLRDVGSPCPPQVITEKEMRAGVDTLCLLHVSASAEARPVATRPLKRAYAQADLLNQRDELEGPVGRRPLKRTYAQANLSLSAPTSKVNPTHRTLTDWRRFEKLGSLYRPGLAEEEFLGLFVQCDTCHLIVLHRIFYEHHCER